MIPYSNKSGQSGVIAYETGAGFIKVKFIDGALYTYSNASAGKQAVDTMKKLAAFGKGLSTYISQNVKDKYAEKG